VAVGGGDPPAHAKVQIWDTAGQERFRSITTSYFVGAMGLVLCYDVTDRKSFESVRYWARQATEAQQQDGPAEGPPSSSSSSSSLSSSSSSGLSIVLVGNKTDLASARSVSTEEGAALAASFAPPMRFFEASALRNQNVAPAFLAAVEDVVARLRAERAERAALRCGGEEFELVRSPGPTPVLDLARTGWGSSSAAASAGSKCLATSRPECCAIS
jgi:GTPase SAR1 family protein